MFPPRGLPMPQAGIAPEVQFAQFMESTGQLSSEDRKALELWLEKRKQEKRAAAAAEFSRSSLGGSFPLGMGLGGAGSIMESTAARAAALWRAQQQMGITRSASLPSFPFNMGAGFGSIMPNLPSPRIPPQFPASNQIASSLNTDLEMFRYLEMLEEAKEAKGPSVQPSRPPESSLFRSSRPPEDIGREMLAGRESDRGDRGNYGRTEGRDGFSGLSSRESSDVMGRRPFPDDRPSGRIDRDPEDKWHGGVGRSRELVRSPPRQRDRGNPPSKDLAREAHQVWQLPPDSRDREKNRSLQASRGEWIGERGRRSPPLASSGQRDRKPRSRSRSRSQSPTSRRDNRRRERRSSSSSHSKKNSLTEAKKRSKFSGPPVTKTVPSEAPAKAKMTPKQSHPPVLEKAEDEKGGVQKRRNEALKERMRQQLAEKRAKAKEDAEVIVAKRIAGKLQGGKVEGVAIHGGKSFANQLIAEKLRAGKADIPSGAGAPEPVPLNWLSKKRDDDVDGIPLEETEVDFELDEDSEQEQNSVGWNIGWHEEDSSEKSAPKVNEKPKTSKQEIQNEEEADLVPAAPKEESIRLYVSPVPDQVENEDLIRIFQDHGQVTQLIRMPDFCFIDLEERAGGLSACKALHKSVVFKKCSKAKVEVIEASESFYEKKMQEPIEPEPAAAPKPKKKEEPAPKKPSTPTDLNRRKSAPSEKKPDKPAAAQAPAKSSLASKPTQQTPRKQPLPDKAKADPQKSVDKAATTKSPPPQLKKKPVPVKNPLKKPSPQKTSSQQPQKKRSRETDIAGKELGFSDKGEPTNKRPATSTAIRRETPKSSGPPKNDRNVGRHGSGLNPARHEPPGYFSGRVEREPLGRAERPVMNDREPPGRAERPVMIDREPPGRAERPVMIDREPPGRAERPVMIDRGRPGPSFQGPSYLDRRPPSPIWISEMDRGYIPRREFSPERVPDRGLPPPPIMGDRFYDLPPRTFERPRPDEYMPEPREPLMGPARGERRVMRVPPRIADERPPSNPLPARKIQMRVGGDVPKRTFSAPVDFEAKPERIVQDRNKRVEIHPGRGRNAHVGRGGGRGVGPRDSKRFPSNLTAEVSDNTDFKVLSFEEIMKKKKGL